MQETRKPSIEVIDAEIDNIGIESTALKLKLSVNNPLPFGYTIKSAKFKIFLLKEGKEIFLGEGMKEDIRIERNQITRTVVSSELKNTAILSAASGLIGGDIDIVIRGAAAIDLTIVSPAIQFEKKTRIKGFLKNLKE